MSKTITKRNICIHMHWEVLLQCLLFFDTFCPLEKNQQILTALAVSLKKKLSQNLLYRETGPKDKLTHQSMELVSEVEPLPRPAFLVSWLEYPQLIDHFWPQRVTRWWERREVGREGIPRRANVGDGVSNLKWKQKGICDDVLIWKVNIQHNISSTSHTHTHTHQVFGEVGCFSLLDDEAK
jgi:hypothetical protein